MKALQWAFWVLGLGLQGLLISTLFRGRGREFPALLAHAVCLLGTTIAEISAYLLLGKGSSAYRSYYWSAELLRQSSLFAVVVSLGVHALPSGRRAETYPGMATAGAIVVWTMSVAAYYDPDLNRWMIPVVRNLSFLTGLLTLAVWFAYTRPHMRDITRLMIAAGLGLQMTGEALGQAIRQLGLHHRFALPGSIFIVLAHFLCLFIWWRALSMEAPYATRSSDPKMMEEQ